jgi:NADH dehydrogenase FAD-containing subunit
MVQAQPRGTVRATAVGLESAGSDTRVTGVKLNDGSSLPADHVVLATGSTYPDPIKASHNIASSPEERRAQIETAHLTLVSAKSVVIVGGGTVGVELAAEIAGTWGRHKVVTLITPHDRLLERMPPRAGKLALRWLEKKGVWVILNDRVADWGEAPRDVAKLRPGGGDWKLCTEQGRELRASLVYPCIGGRPVQGPLGTRGVSMNGEVRVDMTNGLRVEGFENVYAAGDCCGTNEEKTAFTADLNASAVAHRILASHRTNHVSLSYPKSVCGRNTTPKIAVVSLHKRNAVMQFNGLVLGGPLPAFVKHLIEFFQVHSALGTPGVTFIWDAVESTNIFLGRFLF